MSVMILEPIAIGQLVAWAKANDVKVDSIRASAYANMVVKLIEMNALAYDDRYVNVPGAVDPNFGDHVKAWVQEGAVAFNRHQNAAPSIMVDAAVIYQFARSLEYQLCECDDFKPGNPVRDFLARVKIKAADLMVYEILGDAAQDAWAPDDLASVRKKGAAA